MLILSLLRENDLTDHISFQVSHTPSLILIHINNLSL